MEIAGPQKMNNHQWKRMKILQRTAKHGIESQHTEHRNFFKMQATTRTHLYVALLGPHNSMKKQTSREQCNFWRTNIGRTQIMSVFLKGWKRQRTYFNRFGQLHACAHFPYNAQCFSHLPINAIQRSALCTRQAARTIAQERLFSSHSREKNFAKESATTLRERCSWTRTIETLPLISLC